MKSAKTKHISNFDLTKDTAHQIDWFSLTQVNSVNSICLSFRFGKLEAFRGINMVDDIAREY